MDRLLLRRLPVRHRFHLDPLLYAMLAAAGLGSACSGQSSETREGDSQVTPNGGTSGSATEGNGGSLTSGTGGSGITGSGGTGTGGTGVGGTGVGGTGVSGSGGTLGNPRFGVCDDPAEPVGNWIKCGQGFSHRPTQGTCPTTVPKEPTGAPPDSGYVAHCGSDAECGYLTYGHCAWVGGGGGAPSHVCLAGCAADADCEQGQVCLCDGASAGRCVATDCAVDADCGEGYFCSSYDYSLGCSSAKSVACQRPDDQCTSSLDCNGIGCKEGTCAPGAGGCGRPFLVGGVERLAATAPRADWLRAGLAPEHLDRLSPQLRAACEERWTEMARMEHASIAAFARFSLELLALGAPADLVQGAAQAMADELRHAELCFGVASAYAGKPLGPASLAVGDSLGEPNLASVVETTLLEGCIGELVAAAEADELARTVSDTTLRGVLLEIAADESQHASLAWRFLRWAVTSGGAEIATLAKAIVGREVERTGAGSKEAACPLERLALGLPSPEWRATLRAEVLRGVVVPCLDALVAETSRARETDAERVEVPALVT